MGRPLTLVFATSVERTRNAADGDISYPHRIYSGEWMPIRKASIATRRIFEVESDYHYEVPKTL